MEVVRIEKGKSEIEKKSAAAVAAGRDNADQMVSEFNEARKRLRKAIERCKKERWKEFCAKFVRARMARGLPPKGLSMDRVARILEDLFITRRAEQEGENHSSRSSQMLEEEEQDLRVTEEDLRTAIAKYLRSAGEIVRIIVE